MDRRAWRAAIQSLQRVRRDLVSKQQITTMFTQVQQNKYNGPSFKKLAFLNATQLRNCRTGSKAQNICPQTLLFFHYRAKRMDYKYFTVNNRHFKK